MMVVAEGEGAAAPAAEPVAKPSTGYMIGAYIGVFVAAAAAILLASKNDVTIGVSEGFAPFAVIYLVAQAIERGLQPLTYLVGRPKEKSEVKKQLKTAKSSQSFALVMNEADKAKAAAAIAAAKQKNLDVIVADRAVLFWAIATAAALLVCGLLELGLIQNIAKVTDSSGDVPNWFQYADVAITGIAIGSGTKPLHDLIAFIQNTKQKSEPGGGQG